MIAGLIAIAIAVVLLTLMYIGIRRWEKKFYQQEREKHLRSIADQEDKNK